MPDVKNVLRTLGNDNVRYLIAPDAEHYLFLTEWATAYPSASLVGPAVLSPKLSVSLTKALNSQKPSDVILDSDFLVDFDYEFVPAAANEILLYYKPDQTLLVADLMMNLRQESNIREPTRRAMQDC